VRVHWPELKAELQKAEKLWTSSRSKGEAQELGVGKAQLAFILTAAKIEKLLEEVVANASKHEELLQPNTQHLGGSSTEAIIDLSN
jgi:hypothetical protein